MTRLKLFIPLGIFVVLAGFLYVGLRLDPNHLPSALVGKPLPAFSLPQLTQDHAVVTQESLLGEPFLLNVWATWCPTCVHEHPYLMQLAERGIKIVGLNYKDERAEAQRWLQRLGDPYQLNIDDAEGRLGLNLGVYGAPETFVVDAEGIIVYRHAGDLNERVWQGKIAPIFQNL